MSGKNWAAEYHNKGFVVRPMVVETDFFELPTLPKPRDAYAVKVTKRVPAPCRAEDRPIAPVGFVYFDRAEARDRFLDEVTDLESLLLLRKTRALRPNRLARTC